MKRLIRVGTRQSKLALVQTEWVINEIRKVFPEYEFEIVRFNTQGDIILDRKLDKIGGKGLFTKELETALIERTIDMAVHSMKDMPASLPEGLTISAVSKREDPRDVLITLGSRGLDQLGENAVIGTSSIRREAQIDELKPGLVMKTLRGNVPTRIKKLQNREYDAIILAMAGINRLGHDNLGLFGDAAQNMCMQCFDIEQMVPAVGQGALCIETRMDDDVEYLLRSIHDEETFYAVTAERAYMKKLNGSCSTPIAAHAVINGDNMKIYAFLAMEDRSRACRDTIEGRKIDAAKLGEMLADKILKRRDA